MSSYIAERVLTEFELQARGAIDTDGPTEEVVRLADRIAWAESAMGAKVAA